MYAVVSLDNKEIEQAKKLIDSSEYDHSEWFFGSKKVRRWFGYSYGYKLCKEYSDKTGKTAAELVNTPASKILRSN